MEKKIESTDIKAMSRYGWLMTIGMVITVIMLPLSWYLAFIPGLVMAVLLFIATMYCATKVESIKKQYDVQTYREIVAFSKGDTLDEIAKVRESGKRKYQKFIIAVCCGIFALIVSQIIWFVLN